MNPSLTNLPHDPFFILFDLSQNEELQLSDIIACRDDVLDILPDYSNRDKDILLKIVDYLNLLIDELPDVCYIHEDHIDQYIKTDIDERFLHGVEDYTRDFVETNAMVKDLKHNCYHQIEFLGATYYIVAT